MSNVPNNQAKGKTKVSFDHSQNLEKKAASFYSKEKMSERLTPLYLAMLAFLAVAVIYSFATEVSFMYVNFSTLLGHAFGMAAAIVFAVAIEIGTLVLGSLFFFFVVNWWIGEGAHYKLLFPLVFILAVLFHYGSITLSIKAAPIITDYYGRILEPKIKSAHIMDINKRFDGLIATEQSNINNAQDLINRNYITKGTPLLEKAQERKLKLESQRELMLKREFAKYDRYSDKYESNLINRGMWLRSIAGISEAFKIIEALFFALVIWGVAKEGDTKTKNIRPQRVNRAYKEGVQKGNAPLVAMNGKK